MRICVTGASRGLGRALCLHLTRAGHLVWGTARSRDGLRETQSLCPKDSLRISVMDIAENDAARRWNEEMRVHQFEPDALILNASILREDMKPDAFDGDTAVATCRTNLEGHLRCVEAFLPIFLKHQRGTMTVISSTSTLRPSLRSASYSASKAGIAMAFRSLDLRYCRSGVRFKNVHLGPIRTDMWEGNQHSFLVPPAEKAASAIASFLHSSQSTLYYPFLSTTLLRLSMFVPDRMFAAISSVFLR